MKLIAAPLLAISSAMAIRQEWPFQASCNYLSWETALLKPETRSSKSGTHFRKDSRDDQ
jgi:hypothetical protein